MELGLAATMRAIGTITSLLTLLYFITLFPRGGVLAREKQFQSLVDAQEADSVHKSPEAHKALLSLHRAFADLNADPRAWLKTVASAWRAFAHRNNHAEMQLSTSCRSCQQCKQGLPSKPDRVTGALCHTRHGGRVRAEVAVFKCPNCKTDHMPSYWQTAGGLRYFHDPAACDYFMATKESAYEVDLLLEVDAHMHRNHASYRGLSDVYNDISHTIAGRDPQQVMDRRSLGETHLRWILVKHLHSLGQLESSPHGNLEALDADIAKYMPSFLAAFTLRWGRHHHCSVPGCRLVAGADGHMKARRSICANHARDMKKEFPAMSGPPLHVGCTATPAPRSRYCHHCRDVACPTPSDVPDVCSVVLYIKRMLIDDQRGIEYYTKLSNPSGSTCQWLKPQGLDAIIILEFHSRQGTVVPPSVAALPHVRKYAGLNAVDLSLPPSRIHARRGDAGMACADDNCGTCNTDKGRKDKGALNATTAGVLAVTWSCGVVISLSELYGAESLTQVYAHLATLWRDLDYTPPYFFYDDGCHLARFITKPARLREATSSIWQRLFAATQVFVDRMHFKNHVDPWCKQHMDPDSIPAVANVNTEACEQLFSWMSGFKHIVRHMNEARFLFFITHMCHVHNAALESRLKAQGRLLQAGCTADLTKPPATEVKAPLRRSPLYEMQVAALEPAGDAPADPLPASASQPAEVLEAAQKKVDKRRFQKITMKEAEAWLEHKGVALSPRRTGQYTEQLQQRRATIERMSS